MRHFPRQAVKSIQIFRAPSTGDRKYPTIPTYTVEGAFLPLDRKVLALEGGFYVDPHEVYFNATVDVLRSDQLLISGVIYYARKIMDCEIGAHPHKRVFVSTEA